MHIFRNITAGRFLYEGEAGGSSGGSSSGAEGTSGGTTTQQEEWKPPTREEWEATTGERDRAKQAAADADKRRRDIEKEAAKGDAAKERAQLEAERDELRQENEKIKSDLTATQRNTMLSAVTKDKTDPKLVVNLLKDEDYTDERSLTKAVDAVLKEFPRFRNDATSTQSGSLPGGGGTGGPADKSGGMNAAIRAAAGRG